MRWIEASCHCGAVHLKAHLRGDGSLQPRRCKCSFCARRQAGNVSVDWDSVTLLSGADVLSCYQFGTKTAEHYFCKICGIYTHHRRFSDPTEAGVNIGCIPGMTPDMFEPMEWADGRDL